MKAKEAESRIQELRRQAKENPEAYARRIRFFLAFGTLALIGFLLLALLLLCLALALIVKGHLYGAFVLGSGSFGFFAVVGSMLLTHNHPLDGEEATRDTAPKLWQVADRVTARLGSPPFDQIRIVSECNASVGFWRPMAMIGVKRPILILGLPLLMALDEDQCEAVILHEAAHLSRGDVAVAYGCAMELDTWSTLASDLSQRKYDFGSKVFARWYVPQLYFLMRGFSFHEEFASDEIAAKVISPQVMGETILRIALLHDMRLTPYVEQLEKTPHVVAAPAYDFFAGLASLCRTNPPSSVFDEVVFTLRDLGDHMDTHPSVHDRLRHIQYQIDPYDDRQVSELAAKLTTPVVRSAWDAWSSPVLSLPARQLGEAMKAGLRNHFEEVAKEKASYLDELEKLNQHGSVAGLTREEQVIRAFLVRKAHGAPQSLPLYQELLRQDPADEIVLLHLGLVELEIDPRSKQGAARLERILDSPASDELLGAMLALHRHYLLVGDRAKANAIRNRAMLTRSRLADAEEEKERVKSDAELEVYTGSLDPLQSMRQNLQLQTRFREAYVVVRRLQEDRRQLIPTVVVFFEGNQASAEEANLIFNKLREFIPENWQIVSVHGRSKLAKRVRAAGRPLWALK